jgi:hypothetical protein
MSEVFISTCLDFGLDGIGEILYSGKVFFFLLLPRTILTPVAIVALFNSRSSAMIFDLAGIALNSPPV